MSKGVMLSHAYLSAQATIISREFNFLESDVLYCPFPLHHCGCDNWNNIKCSILRRYCCFGKRFSASRFWDDIRYFEATVFDYMGATLSFLMSKPELANDSRNSVRLAWGFRFRPFGVSLSDASGWS